MNHYRFANALLALDEVIAMQDDQDEHCDTGGLRVYFRGNGEVVFRGDDAKAMRLYLRRLPEPPLEALTVTKTGSVSANRDLVTGKPLSKPHDRKHRQNVSGA